MPISTLNGEIRCAEGRDSVRLLVAAGADAAFRRLFPVCRSRR